MVGNFWWKIFGGSHHADFPTRPATLGTPSRPLSYSTLRVKYGRFTLETYPKNSLFEVKFCIFWRNLLVFRLLCPSNPHFVPFLTNFVPKYPTEKSNCSTKFNVPRRRKYCTTCALLHWIFADVRPIILKSFGRVCVLFAALCGWDCYTCKLLCNSLKNNSLFACSIRKLSVTLQCKRDKKRGSQPHGLHPANFKIIPQIY